MMVQCSKKIGGWFNFKAKYNYIKGLANTALKTVIKSMFNPWFNSLGYCMRATLSLKDEGVLTV